MNQEINETKLSEMIFESHFRLTSQKLKKKLFVKIETKTKVLQLKVETNKSRLAVN